ncbi:hypothetical protein H0Z60_21250 [Ectothiorhodospiraceae bacterium WFHF3C12]|nr:hypothetical protein [Ectothiorhodospiraceae bacterium WFHF3C12]
MLRRALCPWLFAVVLAMPAGNGVAGVRAAFDKVAAVPTVNGHASPELLPWLHSVELGPDGRVALDLERRFDWVLLLVDSDAPRRERVVGYVTYSASAVHGDRRIRLRLSRATLEELARRDDGYRNAVNLYLNHDPDTGGWLMARPRQVWRGQALHAAVNRTPAPRDYRFAGFGVDLELAGKATPQAAGCGSGAPVGLYPPEPVNALDGEEFGPARGLDPAGCPSGDSGVTRLSFPRGGADALLSRMPGGWWSLMRPNTGEVLAELDVSADPPVTTEGHTLVFVPLPRLVLGGDGRRISHVAIDWVRYDVSRRRYVPAEPEVMSKLVHDSFVELAVAGGGPALTARVDPHAAEPIRAIGDQRLGAGRKVSGPGRPEGVVAVSIGYEMQGVAYQFTWRSGE